MLDISSDGRNNDGVGPGVYSDAIRRGDVEVNAIVIAGNEAGLADYYRAFVATHPASFVLEVGTYAEYERAMLQKLLAEIAGLAPPLR